MKLPLNAYLKLKNTINAREHALSKRVRDIIKRMGCLLFLVYRNKLKTHVTKNKNKKRNINFVTPNLLSISTLLETLIPNSSSNISMTIIWEKNIKLRKNFLIQTFRKVMMISCSIFLSFCCLISMLVFIPWSRLFSSFISFYGSLFGTKFELILIYFLYLMWLMIDRDSVWFLLILCLRMIHLNLIPD